MSSCRLRGEETVWGPARDLALRDTLPAFVPEKEFASPHVVDQEVLTAANVLGPIVTLLVGSTEGIW